MSLESRKEACFNLVTLKRMFETANKLGQAMQWVDEMRDVEQMILNEDKAHGISVERLEEGKRIMRIYCQNIANLADEAAVIAAGVKKDIDDCLR